MSENELLVIFILTAAIGGAWGARRSGSDGWRGAVVIAVSALITIAIFFVLGIDNALLSILVNIALAGVIGGALKMAPRQIAVTFMGGLILSFVAGGLISLVSAEHLPPSLTKS